MANESPPSSALMTAVSGGALLLALACLGFLAFYIPSDRETFVQIFVAFGMKLPLATELMLSIPDAVFPAVAGVMALASVTLQLFVRAKGSVALFHMLIVVLCCMAFNAYRESMLQPLIVLMNALAR